MERYVSYGKPKTKMKHKYYCKKCGKTIELNDYDPQFGELTKVSCTNCKGGVKMWKVNKNDKTN